MIYIRSYLLAVSKTDDIHHSVLAAEPAELLFWCSISAACDVVASLSRYLLLDLTAADSLELVVLVDIFLMQTALFGPPEPTLLYSSSSSCQ